MALSVGATAPDFTLPSKPGEFVTLSKLRGKQVVLLFYPAAFTSVCTKELCSVADDLPAYTGLNAEVLAISVDSPWTVTKFASESHAQYPFLSDFNKTVIRDYDVVHHEFAFGLKDVAQRAVFIVDPQGVIKYAWVGAQLNVFPDLDAVKQALQA